MSVFIIARLQMVLVAGVRGGKGGGGERRIGREGGIDTNVGRRHSSSVSGLDLSDGAQDADKIRGCSVWPYYDKDTAKTIRGVRFGVRPVFSRQRMLTPFISSLSWAVSVDSERDTCNQDNVLG